MDGKVVVTGATGYVGGRLVPELLTAGHDVRCVARTPSKLQDRPWRDRVEVVRGDVLDEGSMAAALEGADAAYYLVHSMGSTADFRERDRRAARAFAAAAERAGLRQVIYLGGLGREGDTLSPHLASRHEVGRILAAGSVPVTELRAAVIIGSGSASFEMLRSLVDVLPVMVTPTWVRTRCQPIAIRDVLAHLTAVLRPSDPPAGVHEIGGPDTLTYEDLMRTYAEVAGLPRRRILPVPVLTPRLSSAWVGLVTPLPVGVARPLVDSLVNEVVVTSPPSIAAIADHEPMPIRRAIEVAIRRIQDLEVPTTWAGADLPERDRHAEPRLGDPDWAGGVIYDDVRAAVTAIPADRLFEEVLRIGGDTGYHSAEWLWRVRGWLDVLVGGVGLRRGRRHPAELEPGDPLDFWRVETLEPGRLLRLRAEMRLPGTAWLEFAVEDRGGGGSRLVQRARFHPRGLLGRLYWLMVLPFHRIVFPGMLEGIVAAAELRTASPGRPRRNPPR